MNSLLSGLSAYVPAALMVLCVITALLIAGLAVQYLVRRSPAARHAVLLWTLIAVGLSPILISAMRMAAIPAPKVSRVAVQRMNVLLGSLKSTQTHSLQHRLQTNKPSSIRRRVTWIVGRRNFHKPVGTRSRFAHHPPHQTQRAADFSSTNRDSAEHVCLPSLVEIFREYVFQIRSRFPWRWATFGPSSCFRPRWWTNWISSSSCRC